MSEATDVLFRPFRLKGLELKNRIVMAPMTRAMAEGGIPGTRQADYYRRRAEGGVGLILSEGTVIDRPASRNLPGIPFFHGEAALAGWKGVIDAVHGAGGNKSSTRRRVGLSLRYMGRDVQWDPRPYTVKIPVPVKVPAGAHPSDDDVFPVIWRKSDTKVAA